MNQQIWSSITFTILTTVIGTAIPSHAEPTGGLRQSSEEDSAAVVIMPTTALNTSVLAQLQARQTEINKGEFQPQTTTVAQDQGIAKIRAYQLAGRQVATLTVHSIPVLTFLSSSPSPTEETSHSSLPQHSDKTASRPQASENRGVSSVKAAQVTSNSSVSDSNNDPVLRAQAVAAQINQLDRQKIDAEAISVRGNAQCHCYSISVNDTELVRIDEKTILPDTTENLAEDARQATNRLRRLMGNALPLEEIPGQELVEPKPEISQQPAQPQIKGMASWYGPGFHGRLSASGERFNQNAMTAAHRHLPFGTSVRVTNLNNGRSVVVRINDRGPFVRGRVIDLSAGAAKALGMINSGTAPVRVEVVETQ
ncbi:septal ring lytic transglycosylase RlpA family protein [Lyngbya aestuarii]|uniref:septal ring lytic transglycosylase RlpA family protein n=1 Tax=Lyngbya aestuarii TaxID=118322 RepID=UPI00403DBF86